MPTDGASGSAVLLLLADGRFPAGGYAHSGGLEPAVVAGTVRTVDDLEQLVSGRLRTAGVVAGAFAAAACRLSQCTGRGDERRTALDELDHELDARVPSPAQRATSRALGRQLVRALSSIAPETDLTGLGSAPHQPIALGVAYGGLGLSPTDAAVACLHETAAGPVAAAVRLLTVDPYATYGVLHRLAPLVDHLSTEAVERSTSVGDLPSCTGPLLDVYAERHRHNPTRLFAS